MGWNMEKIVIIIFFVQLAMKCIFKKKSTLAIFDDQRCYINSIESEAWG